MGNGRDRDQPINQLVQDPQLDLLLPHLIEEVLDAHAGLENLGDLGQLRPVQVSADLEPLHLGLKIGQFWNWNAAFKPQDIGTISGLRQVLLYPVIVALRHHPF